MDYKIVKFGKYKGVRIEWLKTHDPNYYKWFISINKDFSKGRKEYYQTQEELPKHLNSSFIGDFKDK